MMRRTSPTPPASDLDPSNSTLIDGVSHGEVEAERALLLRRRLIWCASVFTFLALVSLYGESTEFEPVTVTLTSIEPAQRRALEFALTGIVESAAMVLLFGASLAFAVFSRPNSLSALSTVCWMITGAQALTVFRGVGLALFVPTETAVQNLVLQSSLTCLFTVSVASLLIPWTIQQALRPMLFCALLHQGAMLLLGRFEFLAQLAGFSLILGAVIPGIAFTLVRGRPNEDIAHLRVRSRRYSSLARDLFDARRIHEAIFPKPITQGPIHLAYRYRPSQHIGGDFLFARAVAPASESEPGDGLPLAVVMVDVTGHGVASALTVNRLHAEIERTLRELPDTGPGDVLHRLNDYLHYTLAIHSVYATAICLRFDAPGADGVCRVRWASGGHPPALLRRADGAVERLWSTAFMLGVVSGPDYMADERELVLAPGETLLLYTDGAIDTPTPTGGMLEINGVEALFRKASGDAESIVAALDESIARMQAGRAVDDTLFVVISRPA